MEVTEELCALCVKSFQDAEDTEDQALDPALPRRAEKEPYETRKQVIVV